ncbi:MAG: TlpA family protein disulfide reductase [Thermoanaerobaculia bacterium]|nr:TlpA family protein disulfide reductase [Thermoanaerobaculia bacterium]
MNRTGNPNLVWSLVWVLGLSVASCSKPPAPPTPQAVVDNNADLTGTWRGTLASPGGELPFGILIETSGPGLSGWILNADERAPFSTVRQEEGLATLDFSWFDSTLVADSKDGTLRGSWTRTYPQHTTTMAFRAERVSEPIERFGLPDESGIRLDLDGAWSVVFTDEDGSEPARAEFSEVDGRVTGTFLTPTGDYRYLEGAWRQGVLSLSTFDGAHAFLFHATGQEDGSLQGDFWSRDTYHATWTATPLDAATAATDSDLPDPWTQVSLVNPEGIFRFQFEDLDGNLVRYDDDRFQGRVVLVNLFGSWCPNCNDEAPLLAKWAQQHAENGLEVVGLAYEYTGDVPRDRGMLRRFAQRHGITYPLLLAGLSDKKLAGATVPDLSAVLAYPTTVFIGRDGKVRRIHSGFAGPGTGIHHQRLVAEMTEVLEDLLAEEDPGGSNS